MEWWYVWWPCLTSKRVAQVCQHQLSFLFRFGCNECCYSGNCTLLLLLIVDVFFFWQWQTMNVKLLPPGSALYSCNICRCWILRLTPLWALNSELLSYAYFAQILAELARWWFKRFGACEYTVCSVTVYKGIFLRHRDCVTACWQWPWIMII